MQLEIYMNSNWDSIIINIRRINQHFLRLQKLEKKIITALSSDTDSRVIMKFFEKKMNLT